MTDPVPHLDLLVGLQSRDVHRIAETVATSSADSLASFGAFARRNQLGGYLHLLAADPALGVSLPAELKDALRRRHAMESRKRELLQVELVRVIDAFRAQGVECIVMKGPELAGRFYGGEDQRSYWDLDILVRQGALGDARRVLRDCGFEQRSPMLFGERISLAVAHALDFAKGEAGLDLHWQFSNHPSFRIDYRRVWERRESWTLAGRSCSVLSREYALTLNLLASFKDIERGAFRLRSFVDLWMILSVIDADMAWDRFFAERNEENVRRICTGVLVLFLLLFQAGTRFPGLAHALERQHDVARVDTRTAALRLIEPTFYGPARRLWASRLYEISRTRHMAWWALSLPVRLNVHKPGKMKRFTQTMRTWLRRQR